MNNISWPYSYFYIVSYVTLNTADLIHQHQNWEIWQIYAGQDSSVIQVFHWIIGSMRDNIVVKHKWMLFKHVVQSF